MSIIYRQPNSPVVLPFRNFPTGLVFPVIGARLYDSSMSTVIARSSVTETPAGSGRYLWTKTMPGTITGNGQFWAVCDMDSGLLLPGRFAEWDIILQDTIVLVPIIESGNQAVATATSQKPFVIKRNDTKPDIVRSFVDDDGNQIPIDPAATIKFNMAPKSDEAGGFPNAPRIHKTGYLVGDGSTATFGYAWATDRSDTNASGNFDIEWEVTDPGGLGIRTFPTDGYLTVTIRDDIDPSMNP